MAGDHGAPEGYAVRTPVMGDFRAVADLVLASDLAGFGEPDYTEEELLADWQGSDLRKDVWLVVAADEELAGYAAVEPRGQGIVYAEGYVLPSHTGRGVGNLLVRLTEKGARDHADGEPPGPRVVIDNTINGEDGAARRLLEAAGYEAARHFRRMAIELQEPPTPEAPGGISIRPCAAEDDERLIFEALDEALRDHWEHLPATFERWQTRKKRLGFDPGLWLLAESSGEVAGAAVCEERSEAGRVSELGVRRPWRHRGIGSALLRRAFAEFYRRGRRKVALAVDSHSFTGATRLYERAGMHTERL